MILKKYVTAILVCTMLLTCFQSCFAATISEATDFVPNPLEMSLTVGVKARESGTDAAYENNLEVSEVYSEGRGIDYKATLDMQPIRTLFASGFMRNTIQDNPELKAEFDAATVATTVSVMIEYPSAATAKADLRTAGVLNAGSIFSEVAPRSIQNNKATITYKNKDNLTAKELFENVDSYLGNISFVLDDAIAYSKAGSHTVSVTLSGQTTISFASKTQVVKYNGQASNIVNISMGQMTEHILAIVPAVPATCLTDGHTEGIICSACNRYDCGADGVEIPRTIPKLNHRDANGNSLKMKIQAINATCSAEGLLEHWTCPLCKNDFDSQESDTPKHHEDYIIPKTEHNPAHYQIIASSSPTCCNPGYTQGTNCGDCGAVVVPVTMISATGNHDTVAAETPKTPTCTENGRTAGEKCKDCGVIVVAPIDVAATGHSFGDWVEVKPATTTETGLKERICQNGCNTKEEVVIPKLAHTHTVDSKMDVITKAPSCNTPGKKQQYCSCGEPVGGEVDIPATGHKLSHVDAVAGNCVEKGSIEHYVCINDGCGEKFRDAEAKYKINSIYTKKDKDNHVDIIDIAPVEPTAEKHGLTAGKKCKACNKVIVKQEKIEKLTRHQVVFVQGVEADCDTTGMLEHWHCSICNKDFQDESGTIEWTENDFIIPACGHNYNKPHKKDESAPAENGYFDGIKICSICGEEVDVKIPADTCTHKIDINGHFTDTYITEVIEQPSCTKTGKAQEECYICHHVKNANIVLDKTEHQYEWVEQQKPTCHKTGIAGHYICTVCEKVFDSSKNEINKPDVLDKIKDHSFTKKYDSVKEEYYWECSICSERVEIKKKDKDGNDKPDLGVDIERTAHIGQKDDDKEREDIIVDRKDVELVATNIIVEEKEEVSEELDIKIHQRKQDESDEVKKLVFDITVEKVIEYESGDVDRELYTETDDFVIIRIDIPADMRSSAQSFIVHRHHVDENGVDTWDELRESNDVTKERIIVAADKSYITIYAKKFSEYAVAAYSEFIPADPTPGVGGVSGGLSYYTIKLNTNGGVVLESIKVKPGTKLTLPTPVRDGYEFVGWYLDSAFTQPFNSDSVINKNITLYAKWREGGVCAGTEEDPCPCLDFVDLDPKLWYHHGVDYVLNNKLMIGTESAVFEPDTSVTRAMLVTILWRAEGKPAAVNNATFKDLKPEYYLEAVEWAAENGIVTGYSDTEFGPEDAIMREQIAAIIHRYAKFKGYDVSVGERTDITAYTDYNSISDYAVPAMQYTVGSGLIKGRTETTLNPAAETTRAEIATILYRFFTEHK